MTLDHFRDVVESLGGTVTIDRFHVAPLDWPQRKAYPRVAVVLGSSAQTVVAPTWRICCEMLTPWVESKAQQMEAMSS
jgi:hypothetical protein